MTVDADSLLHYLCIFCILIKMQKAFLRGACKTILACKVAWESCSTQQEERCSGKSSTDSLSDLRAACNFTRLQPYKQSCKTCVSYTCQPSAILQSKGNTSFILELRDDSLIDSVLLATLA